MGGKQRWGLLVVLGLVSGLAGCDWLQSPPKTATPIETEVEAAVSFRNLILRQSNAQGELLWKIQAERATYSPDRKVAHLKNVKGEFLSGGKPVYEMTAPQAEVIQQQTQLQLNGPVTVRDLRQKLVLTAEEFLWQPDQHQLQARKKPQVRYPQIQLTATEIVANSKTQDVMAAGHVLVQSQRPDFQDLNLRTPILRWAVAEDKIVAGSGIMPKLQGVEVTRVRGPKAGERATGGQLAWDLNAKTLTLQEQARVKLVQPDVEVAGAVLQWQIANQAIRSDTPLEIVSPSQTITAQAESGAMDLARQQVELRGRVQLHRRRNPAQLKADQLVWSLPQQEVQARGNVFYQQQTPFLRVQGSQALGWLAPEKEEVIVSGRVQTQVVPKP